MSWAEEDWTVGLSGRVLQKVKELQVHQERLSRENKQKQLQLDNIHTSLEKQTVKYEEVRGELQSVQRELQSAREETKAAVISRERLTQDLQTKQAQVCSFEGQLDAARTVNNKLTQEVKRLEAELEKLQNSSRSADTTLFSTPCWNTSSPWDHNGSRKEERTGHRDEGQSRTLQSRQRLQFSEAATASLPRQQHKNTPYRHPSDQSDSFSTPLAVFPWERDDTRPVARRLSPSSPQAPSSDVINRGQSGQGVCGQEKDHTTDTDTSLSEIRSRVSVLEEELSSKDRTLKSIQNEMAQSKKELAARELSIQRTRDELSLAHTRMAQESERASGAEQKLRQLQEELKCQRQNAESSRLQHQQRSKELEKQHQKDLIELQKERQCLEKQHQQEVNKLNQELQQARTLHNALQAQADKLSLQKQALDKELETLKEKLKWTEGQLLESQKKEAQTQAKLTEVVREAEGVAVTLEQSRKKERALEEEGRRLAEERADALRLLKELQEQQAASAPVLQPAQFVGQSFSPQLSYSVHSRPSTHTKRPSPASLAERKRDEDEDLHERRAEITASYPSDREPGEGIDSEHITVLISPDSESLQREGHSRKSKEVEKDSRNEVMESDSSGTNKDSTFDHVISTSSHSAAGNTNTSMDDDRAEKAPLKSESTNTSEELRRENATLRSELFDVREELQKRLEDLEAQRRAETEARTRLKQLSRKHASQAVVKEEQDKEWRAQLETEKAETERLRKAMAALEAEMKRGREEQEQNMKEEHEEERTKALEDRESEMIELNIQLKKQLAEVKAQLALEREERKREEEERDHLTNTDMDVKKELHLELETLKAELEELKRSRKDSLEEEKHSVANSPLTYLTLHDDELNSNMVHCDNKPLPSPEQHLLFCQSTNQRNMLVSQATADLIHEGQTVIDPKCSPVPDEGQKDQMASDLEDTRLNYLGGSSLPDQRQAQECEAAPSDLTKEVARLQKDNAKETERANQCQVKLEALQSQVTRQTQQLTMAFEKQSQHISGLLAELQEKESALLRQGEELQRCKQELDAFKCQKEGEERRRREEMTVKGVEDEEQKEGTQDNSSLENSGLQPTQEECAVMFLSTNVLAGGDIVTPDADKATSVSNKSDNESLCSGDEHLDAIDSKSQDNHDSTCVIKGTESVQDGGAADVVAELLALREENLLLKQRIAGLTVPHTLALHTDRENQEDPVKQSQSTGNAPLSCLAEQSSPSLLNDITGAARQSAPQNVKWSEDEGGDSEREDRTATRAEDEVEAVCQLQISHLQQKVVELHTKIQSLSEELAVWRLASQPAPTFDLPLPQNDKQSETQDQISAVRQSQSNQKQTDEKTQMEALYQDVQDNPGNITIIREDELLLSCSSNKLKSRMLFSRLQHSNLSEPKSFHPSKRTPALQDYNQDSAHVVKESEKENQDITIVHQSNTCQTQNKEKGRDTEAIQVSSDKTGHQQHVTKDSHKLPGPKQNKTAERCAGNPDAKTEETNGTNKTSDSSDRHLRTEVKSVSSQTEDSLCHRGAPSAPDLRCAQTQTEEVEEEEDEEGSAESPPVSPVTFAEGAEVGDAVLFSGSFPIPADPARLAERIRRNRTQLSAAFDDTEYEPYGLPEVVMKGFADIPTGPSCPYIVRRGLLGTTVVPASQKSPELQEETD